MNVDEYGCMEQVGGEVASFPKHTTQAVSMYENKQAWARKSNLQIIAQSERRKEKEREGEERLDEEREGERERESIIAVHSSYLE